MQLSHLINLNYHMLFSSPVENESHLDHKMIITNWKSVISNRIRKIPGVYLIYDGVGNCLYIGQSSTVLHRLRVHVGKRDGLSNQSYVGGYIEKFYPQSLRWPIVILDSSDYHGDRLFKEIDLIQAVKPLWNTAYNRNVEPPAIFEQSAKSTYTIG